jgi:hypothetical protein
MTPQPAAQPGDPNAGDPNAGDVGRRDFVATVLALGLARVVSRVWRTE